MSVKVARRKSWGWLLAALAVSLAVLATMTAWASTSGVASSTASVVDYAKVEPQSFTVSTSIPLMGWYKWGPKTIFKIVNTASTPKRDVIVELITAPDLSKIFLSLSIELTLSDGTNSLTEYISLVDNVAIFNASDVLDHTASEWTVEATIRAFAYRRGTATLTIYCKVVPAEPLEE